MIRSWNESTWDWRDPFHGVHSWDELIWGPYMTQSTESGKADEQHVEPTQETSSESANQQTSSTTEKSSGSGASAGTDAPDVAAIIRAETATLREGIDNIWKHLNPPKTEEAKKEDVKGEQPSQSGASESEPVKDVVVQDRPQTTARRTGRVQVNLKDVVRRLLE
jgi:hypothetical protein